MPVPQRLWSHLSYPCENDKGFENTYWWSSDNSKIHTQNCRHHCCCKEAVSSISAKPETPPTLTTSSTRSEGCSVQEEGLIVSPRERERPCFFNLKVRWGVCYKTIIHFVEMKNPNRIINYCFQWEKKKKAFWDRWDWLLFNSQSKESLLAREWKKAWKRKDTGINLLIITVSFYCLVTATIGCCVTRRMKYVA